MRYFLPLIVLLLFACAEPEQSRNVILKGVSPHLIPMPQSLELSGDWYYVLHKVPTIYADAGFENEVRIFSELYPGVIAEVDDPMSADLRLQRTRWSEGVEAYKLTVDSTGITIMASDPHGTFNGLMTLAQWMEGSEGKLRHVDIIDKPKFEHRGMLLDCCRHFMDLDFVKRYIDLLARYKMNVLHWHLTEDQGWRVEIDAYPELTEIGAWRTEKDGSKHGGFYTKEQMREVVAYAESRHIKVIPEIELPGHSSAAIASYPWLSCTGDTIPVENEWGVFKDIYCAGNDSTIAFLETVLDEVLEIFPSDVIHIGGDEAPKTRWENCEKCQHRIQTMGLHDEHELQSWMIGHFAEYLASKGRKLIGWDEILEGGLPEGAMVQSWRGMEGGIKAAEMEREVVMSPTSHAYFDYDVRSTDMEEVYEFDPIPNSLSADQAKFIIGGECNMWTEHAPQEKVDSKVFPRILAMSEVLWTYPEERGFQRFRNRVEREYTTLDMLGVNYGPETVPLEIASAEGGKIQLADRVEGLSVKWLADGKWNDSREIQALPGIAEYQIVAEKNGRIYGDTITLQLADHKALGAKVEVGNGYSDWYTGGGDQAMTDGFAGSIDFRDGHWQALQGQDAIYTIDLGAVRDSITQVDIPCYTYSNAWIFLPSSIEVEYSVDGKSWLNFAKIKNPLSKDDTRQDIVIFKSQNSPKSARFIRVRAINPGVCPDWHDAAGQPSWLFLAEVVVL